MDNHDGLKQFEKWMNEPNTMGDTIMFWSGVAVLVVLTIAAIVTYFQ